MVAPKLTDEMRQALAQSPGGAIPVADDRSDNTYVLIRKDDYLKLHDDHIRRALQISFDQADRGEVSELNMAAIIAKANRRYDAHAQDS